MKTRIISILMMFVMLAGFGNANLVMDHIQFDPAIIAAGDEVDIVIQYHDESRNSPLYEERLGNPEYEYRVMLTPDDTLTKKYVIMEDAEGDNLHGRIYSGGEYNKKFRVKVKNNAPAGNYEFMLVGRWYKNDIPEDTYQYLRFYMPVKKEGIVLDVTTIETVPAEVRPGDNFVKLVTHIDNVGEKDAKSVQVTLDLPAGLKSSYSNNNRLWIGRVNAGDSREAIFFIDVDDDAKSGAYDISYNMDYMDIDNNEYSVKRTVPFLIKPRPYLKVIGSEGSGYAGESGKLIVKIANTGEESAESVDVRIIKQNSQPFNIDVRSNYIGELEPGEVGEAIFDIGINRNAEIKDHDFKIVIRSKGDSDEGDDNIYIYNRRAKFTVEGVAPDKMKSYGLIGAGIVIVLMIINFIFMRSKKKKGGKK